MTERIVAYQHGIYPRSEEVVAATRGLERGRTSRDDVDEVLDADLADFVRVQQQAGLDGFSDGLLRWQDLFRPLVEATEGMRARSLVRWFDNNSFFRAPEIEESPARGTAVPAVFDPAPVPEPRVATLPSPYLFARAADTRRDRTGLMREIASFVLRPVVEGLGDRGYRIVHLEEPWLAFFGIEAGEWNGLEAALGEVREAATSRGVTVVLHTYFGDAAPFADRLRRMPVDAVGIDLIQTETEAIAGPWETGLLLGCLDGRSSVVEPLEDSVRLVRRIAEALEPSALYLSSNSELESLPRDVARNKVLRLGGIARALKGTS